MRLLFTAIIIAITTVPTFGAELQKPLVSTEWLAKNFDDVKVIDVRKSEDSFSENGHIPDSVHAPWSEVRTTQELGGIKLQSMTPSGPDFAKWARGLGINNSSRIVIAHPGIKPSNVSAAARLYWQFKYFGHEAVSLLDGGVAKWKSEGRAVSHEIDLADEGDFQFIFANMKPELLATTKMVERMVSKKQVTMIDTRSLAFYLGLEKKNYVASFGHIPGAKHFPMTSHMTFNAPRRFYEAGKLGQAVAAMGLDMTRPVIAYCNSGQAAAATWFVLSELLGQKNVSLYDGSMHAWTAARRRHSVSSFKMN